MQVIQTAKNAVTEPIKWVAGHKLAAAVLIGAILIVAIRYAGTIQAKTAQGQKDGSTFYGILGKLFNVQAAA
jgi:hypothetical protein